MKLGLIDEASDLLEKANLELEPELLTVEDARRLLAGYARIQRLGGFGVAALSRKLNDAAELARATGTSIGKAKETASTGNVLVGSGDLDSALRHGDVSLDQATEIAKAEEVSPGVATKLLAVAQEQPFHVLKEEVRKAKLEAEQHQDLSERQRAARRARSHVDELGMVHIHLELEPHVGSPIVNRADAEASRLYRAAKKRGASDRFERHLADAYAALLASSSTATPRKPELVVLVSHAVARRGWKDVKNGEVCKIPGVGPVSSRVAREIAGDAFLTGLFYDGKDLRQMRRWTRNPPVEVRLALELGEPPKFDGVKCVDCGNRFKTENDHVEPHVARGPASVDNLKPRCWSCHKKKTERDRRAGKLKPPLVKPASPRHRRGTTR